MAYGILKAHNHSENMEQLQLKFDALVSPDNNYVNILQTGPGQRNQKVPGSLRAFQLPPHPLRGGRHHQ